MPYQITLGPAGSGATFENDVSNGPGGASTKSAWCKFLESGPPGITPQEWELTLLGGASYNGHAGVFSLNSSGTWHQECTKLTVKSEAGAFTGIPFGQAGGNTTCIDLTQNNNTDSIFNSTGLSFGTDTPDVTFEDVQIKVGTTNGNQNEGILIGYYTKDAVFNRVLFTDYIPGATNNGCMMIGTNWNNTGSVTISNCVITNCVLAGDSTGNHKYFYNYRTGLTWNVFNNTITGNDYTNANDGPNPFRFFHGGGTSAQINCFNNVIDVEFEELSSVFTGTWDTGTNIQFNACGRDTDIGPVYASYQYPRVLSFPDSQYNGNFDWAKVSGRVESDGTFNTAPGLGVDKQVFCREVSPGVYYWIAWHDGPSGEFWYCGTSSTDPKTWTAASATGTSSVALLAGTGQTVNGGEGPQSAYVAWFTNGSDVYTDVGAYDFSQKSTSNVLEQGIKLPAIPPEDYYGTLRDTAASLWDLGATTYNTAVNEDSITSTQEPQIRSSGVPSTEVALTADGITAALRSSGEPSVEVALETCESAACPVIVRSSGSPTVINAEVTLACTAEPQVRASGSPTVVNADVLLVCTAQPKARTTGVPYIHTEGALSAELWSRVRSSGEPSVESTDKTVFCRPVIRSGGTPTVIAPDMTLACSAYAIARSSGRPDGTIDFLLPPAGRFFVVQKENRFFIPREGVR